MGNYNPCQRVGCQHDISYHKQSHDPMSGRPLMGVCRACGCFRFSDTRAAATR
jgi:hypothetical protein